MSNLVQWSLLIGSILPLGIAVIQQQPWSTGIRSLVTLAVCALASAVLVVGKTNFGTGDWLASAIPMWITAMASYEHFWKNVGISPAIESVTQLKRKPKPKGK